MLQETDTPTENLIPPVNVDSAWLPKSMSTLAPDIDHAFYVVYWMGIAFFVIIVVAMAYFCWKYKRRTENDLTNPIDHNFRMEVIWSVIPSALLVWLFILGMKGFTNAQVAPGDAYEIRVEGEMWKWNFTYPDGTQTAGELAVPVGKPVKLIMSSKDVLHSFFVPNFRVKQDVVPGMYTTLWFEATEVGEVPIECTEYCGTSHSQMLGKVMIMEEAEFKKWIDTGGVGEITDPVAYGEKLFSQQACVTCHKLDGTKLVGPPLNGKFGTEREFADGSKATFDENYFRNSLLNPGGQVVAGYDNVMPVFKGKLNDVQIDSLIAYLKTQK